MFNQEIHNRIYLVLFSVLAFCLPLNRILSSYVIGLILLNWFLEARFRKKWRSLLTLHHRLDTLLFTGLFFAYLTGMIYTTDTAEGWSSVQVKLSMFVFPLVFATMDLGFRTGNRPLYPLVSLIAGSFLSGIICLAKATFLFLETGDPESFYYVSLSIFHHPGYMAMFAVFSVSILNYFLFIYPKRKNTRWIKTGIIGLIVFFSGFVVLLSSKAGLITLMLIFFLHVSYIVFIHRRYIRGLILVISISGMFMLLLYIFPYSVLRFDVAGNALRQEGQVEESTTDGTIERILIWRYSLELINERFIFGYGTGDVTDALVEIYDNMQFEDARDKKLNAHNQYLQTFLALGITGFLILLLSILLPAIYSIRKKQYIYFSFLLIIGFNFLVESMLLRQAGVVFYAFFNVFLFMVPISEPAEQA